MQHVTLPGRRQTVSFPPSRINGSTFPSRTASSSGAPSSRPITEGVSNPILPAPSQDPHVTLHQGRYYYCESTAEGIFIRVADDFLNLGKSPRVHVWTPPRKGLASQNIWAPELHVLNGRCYIFFAADDGNNANHRMWVLAAETEDARGRYRLAGCLDTGGWAIDGTVLTDRRGVSYLVWSGWPGRTDGQQNIYISRMGSPVQLVGPRVLLARPDRSWERKGMPICEGPQILRRGSKTFIVYSASASWTADYCLGLLVNEGGNFLNPSSWKKVGQVFARNEHAWGVGHCGFVETPQGEDWMLYHAKTRRGPGWGDREVRAQPFGWDDQGNPDFGEPVAREALIRRRAATVTSISQSLLVLDRLSA